MRRTDRRASRETGLRILDQCQWAVIAMADEAEDPYCVPITIARSGEAIYFHGALEGKKAECLRARPQVCLAAVGDTRIVEERFTTEFESVVVRGKAVEVTEAEEKLQALRILCQRHCPGGMGGFEQAARGSLSRTGIWRMGIKNLTAKRKKYGPDGKELPPEE